MKKKALGKGLKAFMPEEYGILKEERFLELELDQLKPNPLQPRSNFNQEALAELAASIRETGILQPIVAVADGDEYKIIVGERRWRAAQKAGLKKVPVLVRTMTEAQQHEASLIENLQREDLNPLEIALAYQKMTKTLNYTQQEVAERVGKDRASVANYMRLLKLPKPIQKMIREDILSMGHARALLAIENEEQQLELARRIVQNSLSVRNIEKKVSLSKKKLKKGTQSAPDPDLLAVQEELIKLMGTKVTINGTSAKGSIKIHYFSLGELNRIYDKIKGETT